MTSISTISLPAPSKAHATCAWCGSDFTSIIDLIAHVDETHLAVARQVVGARAA
jgi:hypothetical protein